LKCAGRKPKEGKSKGGIKVHTMINADEQTPNVNQNHGQNYDSKNMMHTIRLLQSCEQIFKTGSMQIRVENREELLDIKARNWSYETVMQKAENLIKSIEHYHSASTLPDFPDFGQNKQNFGGNSEAIIFLKHKNSHFAAGVSIYKEKILKLDYFLLVLALLSEVFLKALCGKVSFFYGRHNP
jgi:hypothetical protein